ncbi:MAG: hypothetical protein K2X38_00790 [Gemmataceae bacterium]|nr:hypothetical protein [Gemmataceae bacterium]
MTAHVFLAVLAFSFSYADSAANPAEERDRSELESALVRSKGNRSELEKALAAVPAEQRKGLVFLIRNMTAADLRSLTAGFLVRNVSLAYRAREATPWGKDVPEEIFFNDVLPYANVDEKRDDWRKEFFDLCMPIIKDCRTPSEAAQKLNLELFGKLKLKYSTERRAPNQGPKESIELGKASCTGLSIVLSDACRAVCVPARLVGTPLWSNKRGNHTWVEIWDGDWHFTGACEADPKGLDRGWFVGEASQAKRDSFEHAIYAASFKRSSVHFPLVWAMNNKEVPAENVTDRYAKKVSVRADVARLAVRMLDANGKRLAVAVQVVAKSDAKETKQGTSRGETADANDILTFELAPKREYLVSARGVTTSVKTPQAGAVQHLELIVGAPKSDSSKSMDAIRKLAEALKVSDGSLSDLAKEDFSSLALSKSDAAKARELIWNAHAAKLAKERGEEIRKRVIREGKLEMPFYFRTIGAKPKDGRSLWISLHGGGGAPAQVNDQQWENQKKLYSIEEGIYLAPRAPTNTWNLWHEGHIDRMFGRLIEDLIVLEGVNPNRVYVLGYSAGGDGVYQIAPRMADRWAAAAMMAGHPNGVSLLSLRNVPFALQVGANDGAYNRNKVGREYGDRLAQLRKEDPAGYEHFVKIHEGKGHWMNLEDKAALPWMARFSRNPIPERIVWMQTGVAHESSYWLAVPKDAAFAGAEVVAQRKGQKIDVVRASDKISKLHVRLDDRMADLDQPIEVSSGGETRFNGTAPRTIAAMLKTLAGRGDPELMFDAEITIDLK